MIVRTRFDWHVVLYNTWLQACIAGAIAMVVVVLEYFYAHNNWMVPSTLTALLGTAIAILLAFRNNTAYERWWEARTIWGALVNDSRSWCRQALTLPVTDQAGERVPTAWQRRVVRRQIAFAHALRLHLRGGNESPDPVEFLEPAEAEALRGVTNVPAVLLLNQGWAIAEARRAGHLDSLMAGLMEQTLVRFTDELGACERIKRTPFPRQYHDFAEMMVWIFCLIFPFSLVREMGLWTIPLSVCVAFSFQLLEGIGRNIQDPFEGTVHDTPMCALCRTIERDLRNALGETDLPPPLAPKGHVLM